MMDRVLVGEAKGLSPKHIGGLPSMFRGNRAAALWLALLACVSLPASVFGQCSTAAWSGVSGNVEAIGASTVPVGKKYEAQCALTVTTTSAPGYVTTNAPSNEPLFTARFYLLPLNLNISSGDVEVFKALNGGATQIRLSLRNVGGVNQLVTRYRDGGSVVEHSELVPLQSIWQAISMSWSAGNGTGTFSLNLDGVEQFALSGLSNNGEVVTSVDLGILNDPAASGKVVFDAFEMRRTADVPPLLTVNELYNISTRADIGNGLNSAVAGFIINGDTDKCVVVRGRGPSVAVNQTLLADPILTLKSGSTTIGENDNWADHETAAIVQALGKAPTEPLDSAFYICLAPGPYTALLKGTVGTTRGIGIVEVIDVDQGTPFLANISTRALVKTGARRVVAGFIIEGSQSREVLIRGRGPTVNVNNATLLADPQVQLRVGATVLALNDNWGEAVNAAEISATGQAPQDPAEAAILITLQPGAYTVFLEPADGVPGLGIIEVLDQTGGSIATN